MDFSDTPQEAGFRAEVINWLEHATTRRSTTGAPGSTTQKPFAERLEQAKAFQNKKAEKRYASITLPREFGGLGGTPMQQIIYSQEEAKFENYDIVDFFGVGLAMCIPTIAHNGTTEQQERFIATGIRGEDIWCQLFSEPSGGSDVASARTSAVRKGDNWILNGQKVWTSGAHFSDYGIVTTRTDPTVPKHSGMTMFIVDMKARGVDVRPIRQMSNESEFSEVFFTDVEVPDSFRLGAVNDGWNVALSTLMHERAGIGSRSQDFGWSGLLRLARANAVNGHCALDDGAMRENIVDSWITEFGARLLSLRGQTALSRGEAPGPEQSVLKMLKAPILQQNAYLGMDLLGESGLLTHSTLGDDWREIETAWTFGAAIRVAGGSDEILRNIVAERVLGMPPDIRLDKGIPFNQIPS